MTTAQTVFVIALAAIALLIGWFTVFVVSTTMRSDRWYRRR